MKTDEIYVWFLVIPAILAFWILARLFFIAVVILLDRNNAEKFIWNEEINPEKLKVCGFLLLVATFFAYLSFNPFFSNKFTPDLWITFSIGTLGLAGMCLLIENKLRTPSRKYFNNSSVENVDNEKQLASTIGYEISDVSIKVLKGSNENLFFAEKYKNYNEQNGIIEKNKGINQEEIPLQSYNDFEAQDDIIDLNQGIIEVNQPLDAQGSVGHLNKKQKQDGILETISSGKESRRAFSRVLDESSDVVSDDITDEIIQDKIALLKESYNLYCNIDDFVSVLKKKEINKKILFTDKDHKTKVLSKTRFLKLLNTLVDENIGNHPNNQKIEEWISISFDSSNFKNKKITSVDISRLKAALKKK